MSSRPTGVVSAIESTIRRASVGVRAQRRIPCVAGVAVGAARRLVEPTPVRIEHDRTLEGLAASSRRALGDAELGVSFGGESPHLLTVGDRKEGE